MGFLGFKHKTETKEKIRNKLLGVKKSPEAVEKTRLANLGSKSHFWKNGFWKGKHRLDMTGDKHFNWKGGKSKSNHKIRTSLEYKLWREAVFIRDNWTCQSCFKSPKNVEAHHIKSFLEYPEFRFAIDNGITVCFKCHAKLDKYRKLKGDKK